MMEAGCGRRKFILHTSSFILQKGWYRVSIASRPLGMRGFFVSRARGQKGEWMSRLGIVILAATIGSLAGATALGAPRSIYCTDVTTTWIASRATSKAACPG